MDLCHLWVFLQDKGFKVAIITDGRMSGASGKVPSAIHFAPEALDGGMLAKVKTGDNIRFDAHKGEIMLLVDEEELKSRSIELPDLSANMHGFGRELFVSVRQNVGSAEEGASLFDISGKERA